MRGCITSTLANKTILTIFFSRPQMETRPMCLKYILKIYEKFAVKNQLEKRLGLGPGRNERCHRGISKAPLSRFLDLERRI